MLLREIMQKKVTTLPPEATIIEASKLMKRNRIGYLLVVNGQKLTGCVTDRDIALSLADGLDPMKTKVKDIMQKNVVSVSPDTDVFEISKIMARKRVRRLPVLDDNKLVGVVSTSDIAPVIEQEVDNFLHVEEAYKH